MKLALVGGIVACALVGAGLIAGFFLAGSPQQARARALDERRVADLELIAERMVGPTRTAPPALPRNLRVRRADGSDALQDPVSDRPYRYQRIDAKRYRLCATFAQPHTEQRWGNEPTHPAGPACYRFSVEHTSAIKEATAER